MRMQFSRLLAFAILIAIGLPLCAQEQAPAPQAPAAAKPEDSEVWEPEPNVVTPGANNMAPPSDAIVLFDGKNLDEWVSGQDKSQTKWIVANGALTVNKAAGNIETKRAFRNYQLHIEWRIPENVTGSGQARGNSGVFLASPGPADPGYKFQVLHSHTNQTHIHPHSPSISNQ